MRRNKQSRTPKGEKGVAKPTRWQKVWPWLIVLAVYGVIYWFSAQNGSISDIQSGFIQQLTGVETSFMASAVRKMAHVTLYATLGAAIGFAWLRSDARARRYRRALVVALVLGVILGGLDELHQSHVDSRVASVVDVVLDTASATLGALCAAGVAWWRRQSGQAFRHEFPK